MNRCLRERELVLLHAGDGSEKQRRHVRECGGCAERYRRLHDDLALIGQVLRGESPRRIAGAVPARRRVWIPVAAAAFAALLVMNLLFAWQLSRRRVPEVSRAIDGAGGAAVVGGAPPAPLDGLLEMSADDPWLREDLQSLPLGDLES